MISEYLARVAHDDSYQAFTSVLMIHQVLKARTSTDAHVESVKLVPVTSAYALTLRDDRPKPANGPVDQAVNTEYV
jgi:hypothetical protein